MQHGNLAVLLTGTTESLLVNTDVLNRELGNALTTKLSMAAASFAGNTTASINQVGAFINQVNDNANTRPFPRAPTL